MKITDEFLSDLLLKKAWATAFVGQDSLLSAAIAEARLSSWDNGLACRIRQELVGVIAESTGIDWLLHLTRKRYRDHTSHPRSVGLLGEFLSDVHVAEGQSLASYAATAQGRTVELAGEVEVGIAWWIAALLHDHGYPLAHMLQYFPAIDERPGVQCPGQEAMRALLRDYFGRLYCDSDRFKEIWVCRESLERKRVARNVLFEYLVAPGFLTEPELDNLVVGNNDKYEHLFAHGLWSAANLSAKLSTFSWLNPGVVACKRVIQSAIRAMAWHSGPPEHVVQIWKEPIAFMLILCDELQEWDRRMLGSVAGDPESDSIELRGIVAGHDCMYFHKEDPFRVEFNYHDDDRLRRTRWDFNRFQTDKCSALSRLRVPRQSQTIQFNPQEICFHVRVPSRILLVD